MAFWMAFCSATIGTMHHADRTAMAQSPTSSFELCMAYVAATEELETKFDSHRAAGLELIAERRDTFVRLLQTRQAIEHLVRQQTLKSLQQLESQMLADSMAAELNGMIAAKQQASTHVLDVRYDPTSTFGHFFQQSQERLRAQDIRTLGNHAAQLQVNMDAVAHDMKTFDEAGRISVERYMSQVRDLERIVQELVAWDENSRKLFHQYWQLADVAGVKSEFECRMALRELEKAAEQNAGALFARAVTLIRLERGDEALPMLDRLLNVPAVHWLALAARGEILMRSGQERAATVELRKTLPVGQHDPRVRMQRAMALAAGGQLALAETEWEAVLKLGGHEVAARRGLALINSSQPTRSGKQLSRALEQAELASQLAPDEWSCQLALALALEASGESDKAFAAAEKAAKLAVGENQSYCEEIVQQIKKGAVPVWEF